VWLGRLLGAVLDADVGNNGRISLNPEDPIAKQCSRSSCLHNSELSIVFKARTTPPATPVY